MANIVSVTNPIPGQESNNYRSPISPNDPKIQNVPDPTRVGRADARNTGQDGNITGNLRRYDSNFQAFLQELRDAGVSTQTLSRFLIGGQGYLISSGLTEGVAQELSQFLQMLKIGPEELLSLLKEQTSSSARFAGPLFDALREAMREGPSPGLKNDILQFLRRYNDYSSTAHIARNMQQQIKQMSWFMPERFSGALGEQLSQLEGMLSQGNRQGALALLQNTLIPYMSDYVSQLHDRGVARNLLSMLVLNIARYENGSPQNMLQSFYQLLGYSPIKTRFGALSGAELTNLLQQSSAHINEAENELANQLSRLASHAMRGEGPADMRQAIQSMMEGVLVNQSVYMPLMHAMLPVEMAGRTMFSEIWVDPNAEQDSGNPVGGRTMRMLLKFDIQGLGMFDLILANKGEKIDISLLAPPHLEEFNQLFEQKISSFATDEGFRTGDIRAMPMQRPVTLTEIFPQIFEKKDSIDVSI